MRRLFGRISRPPQSAPRPAVSGSPRSRARSILESAIAQVAAAVEPQSLQDEALATLWASPPSADTDSERGASATAAALLSALRAALPAPSPCAPVPLRTQLAMDIADIIRPYTIGGTPGAEHRQALRDNARAVLDAFDSGAPEVLALLEEGGGTPAAYQALYLDLATALPSDNLPAVSASESELSNEQEIGVLFPGLVEAHPQNGLSLRMTFGVPTLSGTETFDRVYNSTPAVAAAGADGAVLAGFGLTPLDVYNAADVVGDLVERLAEDGVEPICLNPNGTLDNTDEPEDLFIEEVALVTGLDAETSRTLLGWLLGTASGAAPYVFTGVHATQRPGCPLAPPVRSGTPRQAARRALGRSGHHRVRVQVRACSAGSPDDGT